jgi:hypothetical protein
MCGSRVSFRVILKLVSCVHGSDYKVYYSEPVVNQENGQTCDVCDRR